MIEKCQPSPDCKYWNHEPTPCPFEDKHHKYGRPPKGIARRFALLDENVEIGCRVEHERIHNECGVLKLPSLELMKQAIERSRNARKENRAN